MNTTKKSHYVWQHYLKNWAHNKSIYCSFNGNKPIKTSLDNVANKRYFYKIAPFNKFEKEFLIKCIDKSLPQFIISGLLNYIEIMEQHFQKQEYISDIDDTINIQIGENIMTKDEESFISFFDKLTCGDVAYCIDDENLISFYIFVLMQYFRTKRIYDDLANIEKIRVESIITPFRRIMSFNMANYLFTNNHHTILLHNNTNQEFITSSQPVINTYVDYSILDRHTDKLELYYPISTEIAILITNDGQFDNITTLQLNLDEVDYYNRKIINASQMQVYCSTATALDRYIDKIG